VATNQDANGVVDFGTIALSKTNRFYRARALP
jgi:hypothetical protein